MNIQLRLMLILVFTTLTVSCGVWPLKPTPTPLPGWRSPVSDLLVDEFAFPEGWSILHPEDTSTDPTVNHVGRRWGRVGVSGTVAQGIWRAYTIADAEAKYDELRASQFYLRSTPPPSDFYVPFEPPDELSFQSQVADEFYLACGWRIWAQCEVVARYRNYVVDMRLDREAECEGHITHGLTYPEIEAVVRAMDAKFAEALETFSTPPP